MTDMKRIPAVIGRKTFVDFPSLDIACVPAKVDTGADNSAIWATDIQEHGGTLSFVLFDASSPHYTGEEIKTKKFKIVSVKNSFGIAEFRYKVALPAVIEGKKLTIYFTLADRSNNSSPLLIGRKTLQGKFLVDVSLHPDVARTKRVLIVSARNVKHVQHMTETLHELMEDTEIDQTTYDAISISLLNGKMQVYIEEFDRDMADYDIVHFRTSVERDVTASLATYASNRGVRVLDGIIRSFPTSSKLYEYTTLCWHDIRIPDSFFFMPKELTRRFDFIKAEFGLPFILKDIHANRGEMNDLIRDKSDFDRVTKAAFEAKAYLVAQRYVENTGDYRLLVMGKQISLIIHRSRSDKDTHLNNISSGGSARLVEPTELPSQVLVDSIRATALMNRDIAGVDMVQDSITNKWYCFEVNDGPQISTGVFIEEKQQALAAFLQRELEK
jgi:glutathione synthase/RimK-type ligase-like ATP-grasp enzyme